MASSYHLLFACSASWTDMPGDDAARFCGLCRRKVYDSMAVDECELERLLAQGECLRVHRDDQGRVLTRDRLRGAVAVAAVAALGGCASAQDSDTDTAGGIGGAWAAEVGDDTGAAELGDTGGAGEASEGEPGGAPDAPEALGLFDAIGVNAAALDPETILDLLRAPKVQPEQKIHVTMGVYVRRAGED